MQGEAMTPARTTTTTDRPSPAACGRPIVYWHHQLPPFDAELLGEHVLEATGGREQGSLAHRDELWDSSYRDLMANTEERFAQEVARVGGHYAHVLDESIPRSGSSVFRGVTDFVMSPSYHGGTTSR
jgi:hypothetical protein